MATTLVFMAALFLPLFPLSAVFNQGFTRLRHPLSRAVLLLIWPQFGVFLIGQTGAPVPDWLMAWALLSAGFYAYRAIALRELGLWIGFLATSAWALLWVTGASGTLLHVQALGFSAPLAVLSLLAGDIERRFGAAHTRLNLGLATVAPRTAGVFVIAILAVVATPLFPGFFTLIAAIVAQSQAAPLAALGLGLIWLLWTWSGARLLQGIVVGPGGEVVGADLSQGRTRSYAVAFVILALAGMQTAGALL